MAEAGRVACPRRLRLGSTGHAAADHDHRRRAGVLGSVGQVGPPLSRCRSLAVRDRRGARKAALDPDFYWNLGVTAGEVGTALAIGGLSGLCRARARRQPAARQVLRALSLLSRADAEDHLLPGDDHVVRGRAGIEGRDGRDLLLLPDRALDRGRHAPDRQGADPGRPELPRQCLADGDEDLPAGDAPSHDQRRAPRPRRRHHRHAARRDQALQPGIGFLIIQAYSLFDMPRMYAMLIVLFVLAIGANALVGRLGGLMPSANASSEPALRRVCRARSSLNDRVKGAGWGGRVVPTMALTRGTAQLRASRVCLCGSGVKMLAAPNNDDRRRPMNKLAGFAFAARCRGIARLPALQPPTTCSSSPSASAAIGTPRSPNSAPRPASSRSTASSSR